MSTNGTKNEKCEMEQKMKTENAPWVSTDFPQLRFPPFFSLNKKIENESQIVFEFLPKYN